jgi:hypothetical protein
VALATCRTLPEDARVTLLVDAGPMTLEFEGQVTWTKRTNGEGFAGVRFDRSNSDDMKRLRRLIGDARRSGRTFEGDVVAELGIYRVAEDGAPSEPLEDDTEAQSLPPAAVLLEDGIDTVRAAAELANLAHGTPSAGNPLPAGIRDDEDDEVGMLEAVIEFYADEADEEERTYLTQHSMLAMEHPESQ